MSPTQSQQVALAEDDDMVENLSPERADETLRVSVLPTRPLRGLDLADAEMVHARIERAAVDSVPISDQANDVGVEGRRSP